MTLDPSEESEVVRVAMAFARALARGDWAVAHNLLAPSLRNDCQTRDMKREFEEMTSYWDKPPTEVKLGHADSERAYVAISSESASYGTVNEAVDVRVIQYNDDWLIDHIVWGRPQRRHHRRRRAAVNLDCPVPPFLVEPVAKALADALPLRPTSA